MKHGNMEVCARDPRGSRRAAGCEMFKIRKEGGIGDLEAMIRVLNATAMSKGALNSSGEVLQCGRL